MLMCYRVSLVCACVSIFGHEDQDAEDVVYINWLNMVRAGLLGLEFYTSESSSWRQVGDERHLLCRHEDQLMFTHAYSVY
jgi:hypothetical protein